MAHNFEDDMTHANFDAQQLNAMENLVTSFFKKNKLEVGFPVDSVALAKKMGFKVFASNLKAIGENADALIAVDENSEVIEGFNTNKFIAYDRSISDEEHIRFAIAHELAHYITEKENGNNVVFAEKVLGKGKSIEEQKMDYIAAAILVPKGILLGVLQAWNYDKCEENIKPIIVSSLANTFKVSRALMARRIEELA